MNVVGPRGSDPGLFLDENSNPGNSTLPSLLILNQPIASFEVFSRLWCHTGYRLCVDGGANRLHDMFRDELQSRRDDYLPDAIHGDLDSLRDDVGAYYAARGVEVSQLRDDYCTDFSKCMRKIGLQRQSTSGSEVLILGSLSGRVDHGLGLLHEMIREERRDSGLRLWLFSETNVSFILKAAHETIRTRLARKIFTENVGLVPIYGPATITTSGLEWDVEDWETRMGTQVSTSNHIKADEIQVRTDAPILFTMEIEGTT